MLVELCGCVFVSGGCYRVTQSHITDLAQIHFRVFGKNYQMGVCV